MIEHISYRQGLTLVKGMKSILMEIPLDKEKFGLSRLMCAPQLYAHLEFKSNNIHRLNQFGLSFKPGAEIFPTSFTFIFIEIDSLYLCMQVAARNFLDQIINIIYNFHNVCGSEWSCTVSIASQTGYVAARNFASGSCNIYC